jgi:hypothetical protein
LSAAFGCDAAGMLLALLPLVAAEPNLKPEGKKPFGN